MFNQIASTNNLLIFLLECLQVKGLPLVSSSMHSFFPTNQYNWGHVAMFASSSESRGLQMLFLFLSPASLLPSWEFPIAAAYGFLGLYDFVLIQKSEHHRELIGSWDTSVPSTSKTLRPPLLLFSDRFGDTPELSFLPELGESATRLACRTSWYQCPP